MPRRGRPRDPTRDIAIRVGVLEVLAEVGYRGLTMDAVALAAGVGKGTIYRRWPSKEDLLLDVIEMSSHERLVEPDTGSLRGDLIALLASLTAMLAGLGGGANRAVLGVLVDESVAAATVDEVMLPLFGVASRARAEASPVPPHAQQTSRSRSADWTIAEEFAGRAAFDRSGVHQGGVRRAR